MSISSRSIFLTIFFFLCSIIINCSSTIRTVTRIDADSVTDLSGRWNDTDSRLTSDAMIENMILSPWLNDFVIEKGRKPIIIVGTVRNKSSEHINTALFTKDIERELINSGKISFVASEKERQELREEIIDQQYYSSVETTKQLANETGADHMLIGSIISIVDSIGGKKIVYYQVTLELIELESNKKVWIGDKKIKKFINQKKYKRNDTK